MAVKPPSHLEWGVGNANPGLIIIEPTAAKKKAAWFSAERMAFQFLNWLFNTQDEWNKYFEEVTDSMSAITQVVIGDTGTIPGATHDTLQDAIADGALGSDVFVTILPGTYTLEVFIDMSKSGWSVECQPGVKFLKGAGAPTEAIRISGANIRWRGGRFDGWVTTDKVFLGLATGFYFHISSVYFSVATLNAIDDAAVPGGKKFNASLLTTEV